MKTRPFYCVVVVVCDVVEVAAGAGAGAVWLVELSSDEVEVVVVDESLAQPASNAHTANATGRIEFFIA